jgi:hypothetical protein
MKPPPVVKTTFQVGKFTCDMACTEDGAMSCEWSPRVPKRSELTKQDVISYLAHRNVFMGEVAKIYKVNIAIIDA